MSASRRRSVKNRPDSSPSRDFWFLPDGTENLAPTIRPADDPTALIRSLGRPPVSGHETTAIHYLVAVYSRAARLAKAQAIAFAPNLIELDDEG